MAGGIYGVSGVNGVYGINNIYGINSYRNYNMNYASRWNSLSNVLNSAVASSASAALRSNRNTSSADSYLTQLNKSINSAYMANMATKISNKIVTSTSSTSVTGTAQINATVKAYTVKISSLASNQVNKGTELAANSKSVFNPGLNTVKVRAGSTERSFSFAVSEADTNISALNKLASAVNRMDAGIRASVESTKDDKVYLKLESSKTGNRNSFSLVDNKGNAATAAGLNTILTKSQDAVYTIDGKQYTSSSNSVSLDNGKVQLTLKKADNAEFELAITPDTKNSTIPDFYSYLNNMLSAGSYTGAIRGISSALDMFL